MLNRGDSMLQRDHAVPGDRTSRDRGTAPSLEGRVVVVTGGGSGLGAAICRALAAAGAHVVVTDADADRAAKTAETLDGAGRAVRLDVTDELAAADALERAASEHGRLDVLVNNAGVDVTKSISEMSVAEWDRVIAVNLRGPFVLAKLAFEHMREAGGGHIVNIVSTAARRAWANAAAYHASKWGLLGLSHAMHVEGREHGIRVTALIAGGMRTPFLLDRFPDIDRSVLQDPENVAEAVRFVLMQPRGTVIPELMVLPERETSWP
jgi:NAD(P)-dependent dehydrogenase (short-subunit alcohol dehydrogenase family)